MKNKYFIILGLLLFIFQCKEKSRVENKLNQIPSINVAQVQDNLIGDTICYTTFEKFIQTNDTLYKTSNINVINKDDAFYLSIGSNEYKKIDFDGADYEGPGYSLSLFSTSKEHSSKLIIIEAQADIGTAWYYAVCLEDNKIISECMIKEPRSNSEMYPIEKFVKACKSHNTYILMFKDDLIAPYSKVPDNLLHTNGYYILEIKKMKNDTPIEKAVSTNKNRQLRHVFYSNGGILAFYSDGTVTGCPQCDLDKDNIESLKEKDSFATYTSNKTGIVVQYRNGSKSEMKFYVDGKVSEGWAMKDGEWVR
jgi:hypothetical protein